MSNQGGRQGNRNAASKKTNQCSLWGVSLTQGRVEIKVCFGGGNPRMFIWDRVATIFIGDKS